MNELLTRLKEEADAFQGVLDAQRHAAKSARQPLLAQRRSGSTRSPIPRFAAYRCRDVKAPRARRSCLGAFTGCRSREGNRRRRCRGHFAADRSLREAAVSAQALIEPIARGRQTQFDGIRRRGDGAMRFPVARGRLGRRRGGEGARRACPRGRGRGAPYREDPRRRGAGSATRARDLARRDRADPRHIGARDNDSAGAQRPARDSAPSRDRRRPTCTPEAARACAGWPGALPWPKRRAEERSSSRPTGNYELSAVLAAAESGAKPGLKAGSAAALAALQAALADLAGDLDAAMGDAESPELWRRYLDGDRGAFARKLASIIGPDMVDRITALYRDNSRFHEAAEPI